MVTNGQRGADFERRTMDTLRTNGYWVMRSAGSKGAADLVAVKPGQLVLVQCKRSGMVSREEWNALVELSQSLRRDELGVPADVLAVVAFPGPRGRPVVLREITRKRAERERIEECWRPFEPDEIGNHHG